MLQQNPPLADQVYEIILQKINEGEYQPGSQLPSENQLAKQFNVSRPTIRTAFSRLEELGYITKKRGVGTFVTDTPNIVNPLYLSYNVMDRISARGHKPGFYQVKTEVVPADQSLAEKLNILPDSEVLNIHKVFTADEEPIIHFENYIPVEVFEGCLPKEEASQPGATEPFFRFFAETCQREIKFLTSIIEPEILHDCSLPEVFERFPGDTKVLKVEDIGFDSDNAPVFLSIEHLFKDASIFYVVRHIGRI